MRDSPYLVTRQRSPTSYEIASLQQPEVILGKYHVTDLAECTGQLEEEEPVRPLNRRGRPRKNKIITIAPTIEQPTGNLFAADYGKSHLAFNCFVNRFKLIITDDEMIDGQSIMKENK